ncbi:DUF4270 family protein [Chitinophaga silvatica]|uniref:DUF4270 family protein n=1 Tax=Chitinophaga silvatica TaxID=2282649 RepID=A0A3E1Y7S9_9BACT|nr:DUF4270 family protein [Chitinophaga silvatica]RFS21102.1 DUF4270 family protein [Chitinophaga silvatica]
MNRTLYQLIVRQLYGLGAIIVLLFASCEKTGFSYNNIIDNNQQTDYILSDTLTVQVNTVKQDSIPTSGTGVLLTGKKADQYFGTTAIQSYFQIAQPVSTDIPQYGAQYDSIRLFLRPNGYIAGDSMQEQSFNIYRVTSTIQTAKNFYYLYNSSSFSTETSPIGSFNGIIWPHTDKTLSVPLSDQLGQQFFNMLRDKSPDITDPSAFLEFFKGLNVRNTVKSTSVMGFIAADSSLFVRLYYHVNEAITTVKYVDFKMQNSNLQFNQVTADQTGTPLAALEGNTTRLPSESTNNQAYAQPLTGSAIRLDIPYIKTLSFMGQFFKIMKVYLYIQPIAGSYASDRLPPRLALCQADNLNNVTDTLSYGQLTMDNLYNKNTGYTFEITSYVTKQQTVTDYYSRGLMLTPSSKDVQTTLDRLVIGDQRNPNNKLKIQLYYLLYK